MKSLCVYSCKSYIALKFDSDCGPFLFSRSVRANRNGPQTGYAGHALSECCAETGYQHTSTFPTQNTCLTALCGVCKTHKPSGTAHARTPPIAASCTRPAAAPCTPPAAASRSPMHRARHASARHGSARLASARHASARLASARLASARHGSARLASASTVYRIVSYRIVLLSTYDNQLSTA